MTKEQIPLFRDLPVYLGPVSKHPLYQVWKNMLARCYHENAQRFERYGGRGIFVCDEWRGSSRAFVAWGIANGWQRGLQLDRENNDGPYSPGNCRFVSPKVNARNRSDCLRLPDGRSVLDVAEQNGLPEYLARNRVAQGWPLDEACGLVPARPHHRAILLDDGRVAAHVAKANGISSAVWRRRVANGWKLVDAVTVPHDPVSARSTLFLSDGTPLADAIRSSGVSGATVRGRILRGWSSEQAISVSPHGKRPAATVAKIALDKGRSPSRRVVQGDLAQRPAMPAGWARNE